MSENFEPKNDLEEKLLAAQEGRISGEDFLRDLMDTQVFMPVEDKYEIAGLQSSDKAQPLVLEDESGMQVVALFTSPERAKPFLEDFPKYKGGLLTEFTWIAERIGSGVGITLNPGSETGLEMAPEMLQQLKGG
ncbi:SseB family protein [Thiohalomonas denitrificans]|uniref:SseB family protein n=1 Tax=Thiohalomonas denitrificans TaxID=415747 RepID=UPI0026EE788E|nr:SseB family protein [Thiohalomonas denitrificans]